MLGRSSYSFEIKENIRIVENETFKKVEDIHSSRNTNIYHCCVQKSASQWIKMILSDPVIYKYTALNIYTPDKDFIGPQNRHELSNPFPIHTIVSPLYIKYEEFQNMPKPEIYKAFWVTRDPRDLVISRFFSMRYSHAILNEQMAEERKILDKMNDEEGIFYFIEAIQHRNAIQYSALTSWLKARNDKNVMLCRYEDLVGIDQIETFTKIFKHCDIIIDREILSDLLNRYSFKVLTGRSEGIEDVKSHYRKGIAGDWKSYFTEGHKKLFKEIAGKLLIDLDYEKDINW